MGNPPLHPPGGEPRFFSEGNFAGGTPPRVVLAGFPCQRADAVHDVLVGALAVVQVGLCGCFQMLPRHIRVPLLPWYRSSDVAQPGWLILLLFEIFWTVASLIPTCSPTRQNGHSGWASISRMTAASKSCRMAWSAASSLPLMRLPVPHLTRHCVGLSLATMIVDPRPFVRLVHH